MAKKSLNPITEPMFYVLLCFHRCEMCGSDITEYVRKLTSGRVLLGPGTLYAILSTFQEEKLISKVRVDGRRITYAISEKGEKIYQAEIERLKSCLKDAEYILKSEDYTNEKNL